MFLRTQSSAGWYASSVLLRTGFDHWGSENHAEKPVEKPAETSCFCVHIFVLLRTHFRASTYIISCFCVRNRVFLLIGDRIYIDIQDTQDNRRDPRLLRKTCHLERFHIAGHALSNGASRTAKHRSTQSHHRRSTGLHYDHHYRTSHNWRKSGDAA